MCVHGDGERIYICLSMLKAPSRIHNEQVLLDASKEEIQGDNLFPLLGSQEKRVELITFSSPQPDHHGSVQSASCFIDLLIPL